MKLPNTFAPILFSALLSAFMTAMVSAFVILTTQGTDAFLNEWLTACATTWPVAFPTVLFIAPLVRNLVSKITQAQ